MSDQNSPSIFLRNELAKQIKDDPGVGRANFEIIWTLAMHYLRDGEFYGAHATFAETCKCSDRTVRRALSRVVARKHFTVKLRAGRNHVNVYRPLLTDATQERIRVGLKALPPDVACKQHAWCMLWSEPLRPKVSASLRPKVSDNVCPLTGSHLKDSSAIAARPPDKEWFKDDEIPIRNHVRNIIGTGGDKLLWSAMHGLPPDLVWKEIDGITDPDELRTVLGKMYQGMSA